MAKSKEDIVKYLIFILQEKLMLDEEVTVDADIRSDLCADSLDQMEFIIEIEKEFNISISDEDIEIEDLSTINKTADYLVKRKV